MLPGAGELLIILVLALVVFGAGKLSGVGKALGQSVREFKDETSKMKDEKGEGDGNGEPSKE